MNCRWRGLELRTDGNYDCGSPNWYAPFGVSSEHCQSRCPSPDHAPNEVAIQAKLKLLKVIENPEECPKLQSRDRCQHLGGATGERRECPSCTGHVEIKLLACSLHGQCTPYKQLDGVAYCGNCPDYTAKEGD